MIGPGLPGAALEAFAQGFACGQVGTITVRIDDGDGNLVLPTTTANIVELECTPDNAAIYRYLGVFPDGLAPSPYVIEWTGLNLNGEIVVAGEEIYVSQEAPSPPAGTGPCQDWIDALDVAECCGNIELSSDVEEELEFRARQAELVLFELSGRRFTGLCGPVTDRPCVSDCSCFPAQRLAYPDGSSRPIWDGANWRLDGRTYCGCGCLPRVLLSSWPVQGILQVKIDGELIAPSEYRVDRGRWLVRKNGGRWPSCQDLSRDDDAQGTFSVSYWWGQTPDELAIGAAAALACEFYNGCNGGECKLPSQATRIVRQGVTIENMQPLAAMLRTGATGILAFDAFMEVYGKNRRMPLFYAPGGPKLAKRLG